MIKLKVLYVYSTFFVLLKLYIYLAVWFVAAKDKELLKVRLTIL